MITMMRRYRKALQIGLLIVIAVFVATSVFVFGSSGLRGDPTDSVATVNGEAISLEAYQRRYQEYVSAYSATLRERFSPEAAERTGLPQMVIQDVVQETLIFQRARAERLAVNDEELNAHIHAIPNFQDNGRFSLKLYEEVLRRNNLTKTVFEGDIRRRLTRIKVENIVRYGVKLTEGEIEQAFVHNREEVRAAWALIELAPLIAATTTTDAELEAYLKEHAAEFRLPERRRVQYLTFAPKDFIRTVSEAEVEKYYADHAAEFETPRQVKAAHILVRVGETGGSAAEDKARAKVADIIRRAKAGEDFAKLAKELSEDRASAENGGELGFVGKGEMVPAFEAAVFALKKGEVSAEPLRTAFGFHAIKVTDVREGGKKPLREVAAQIRERLQTEPAEQAARAKAEEVRAKLLTAADFQEQAKSLGLSPVEVTISRRPRTGEMAPADTIEETAFALAKNSVSQPIKTPAGFMVLKNVEELPSAVPPLAAIKETVAASVKRRKADAAALARARVVVAESQAGDFAAAAHKALATVGEAGRFSRAKPSDKLPGDAATAALRVPAGATTDPVKTPQGYYVLKVLERFPPDMKDLGADREKLAQEVLARKQTQAWQDWFAAAVASAKIEMNPARLQAPRS
jgi:peptidyl-prolyl cis-trans isomerase D